MSGKYAIETAFRLIDEMTKPMDNINAKDKLLGKAMGDVGKQSKLANEALKNSRNTSTCVEKTICKFTSISA